MGVSSKFIQYENLPQEVSPPKEGTPPSPPPPARAEAGNLATYVPLPEAAGKRVPWEYSMVTCPKSSPHVAFQGQSTIWRGARGMGVFGWRLERVKGTQQQGEQSRNLLGLHISQQGCLSSWGWGWGSIQAVQSLLREVSVPRDKIVSAHSHSSHKCPSEARSTRQTPG